MIIDNVKIIESPFGGAWALPMTPYAEERMAHWFGCEAERLEPVDYEYGWAVEPHALEYLIADLYKGI